MAGSLTIPRVFTTGGQRDASQLDDDFNAIRDYVNPREVTTGTLAARPAFGTAGRWYVATDVNGGTPYVDTGSAWVQVAASVTGAEAQLFRSYLAGLGLANAADADHDITVAVGKARADSDDADLVLGTAITKRIDATWVVGNNEGGLDTGAVGNDTWYHVFLIKRPDTGVVDALFSTSATAPTMPANYTKKRRLGAVKTDGSANIIAFIQTGDEFRWKGNTGVLDLDNAATGTSAITVTHNVPTGVVVWAWGAWQSAAASSVYRSSLDQDDLAPSSSAYPLLHSQSTATGGDVWERLKTNTSGQARWRWTSSSDVLVVTHGWIDRRGRDD